MILEALKYSRFCGSGTCKVVSSPKLPFRSAVHIDAEHVLATVYNNAVQRKELNDGIRNGRRRIVVKVSY